MDKQEKDPRDEGHVKEWQDRARVVLDAKEEVGKEGSPKQSPTNEEQEDVEEKSDKIRNNEDNNASY